MEWGILLIGVFIGCIIGAAVASRQTRRLD